MFYNFVATRGLLGEKLTEINGFVKRCMEINFREEEKIEKRYLKREKCFLLSKSGVTWNRVSKVRDWKIILDVFVEKLKEWGENVRVLKYPAYSIMSVKSFPSLVIATFHLVRVFHYNSTIFLFIVHCSFEDFLTFYIFI